MERKAKEKRKVTKRKEKKKEETKKERKKKQIIKNKREEKSDKNTQNRDKSHPEDTPPILIQTQTCPTIPNLALQTPYSQPTDAE